MSKKYIFVVVTLFFLGGCQLVSKTVGEGKSCGGFRPITEETTCSRGYICDYSGNNPMIADAPGRCSRLVKNKTYEIGTTFDDQEYVFLDENLSISQVNFTDQCEELNQDLYTKGCKNPGVISWNFTVEHNGDTQTVEIESLENGRAKKQLFGYTFSFSQINRFYLHLSIK